MPSMTALTTFVDGTVVHQADLNNLSTNIDSLCQITTGKTAASGVSQKPTAMVHLNAAQNFTNAADTVISWNVADYNTDNMWVGSQPTQFTIQTAGKYRLTIVNDWAGNATGIRSTKIMVNGTGNNNVVASAIINATAGGFDTCYTIGATVQLAVGATVFFGVFQNSGGTLALSTNFGGTWATLEWVSP